MAGKFRRRGCEILTPNFYNYRITTNNGLSDNEINTITNDQQGNVWIGTAYSGINILDKNKKSIRYISENNGLSSNSIKYIFCSKNKTWIGTEKGLDYYDNATNQLFHVELNKNIKKRLFLVLCKVITMMFG